MSAIAGLDRDAAELQERIERFQAVRDGILRQVRQVIVIPTRVAPGGGTGAEDGQAERWHDPQPITARTLDCQQITRRRSLPPSRLYP